MGLFYRVSPKTLLDARNKLFIDRGLPVLKRHGFERSPFLGAFWGRDNLQDFSYELCRLSKNSNLEMLTVHISRGDSWIKTYLNIFELKPGPQSLYDLKDVDGMQFGLPPNSQTAMHLGMDGLKGMPVFYAVRHKLKSFYTESGFRQRLEELGELIEHDLNDIDAFVSRWHQLYAVSTTNWEGKPVG